MLQLYGGDLFDLLQGLVYWLVKNVLSQVNYLPTYANFTATSSFSFGLGLRSPTSVGPFLALTSACFDEDDDVRRR